MIGHIPRIRIAHLPTPLEEMVALRHTLNARPRLFVKRDDSTGLATGGNKTRKLEFLMAEAQAMKADVVITCGGAQSNHARQTAAFARKLGMRPVLVFDDPDPGRRQGNLLIDTILGAELVFLGEGADVDAGMERIAADLRVKGHRPYVIPLGGSNALGAIAYVNAMYELIGQADDMGIRITDIFIASGSGGTHAGMLLGAKLFGNTIRIHGIGVGLAADPLMLPAKIARIAAGAASILGVDSPVSAADAHMDFGYVGEGYGIATESCLSAIRLVARTEGILLDPVYTGKAMAGFIDKIQSGAFKEDETVVFWHTGGSPALFAEEEHFQV